MDLKPEYPPGGTALDPDEIAGLIPSGISVRAQLDELEAANIAEGMQWSQSRDRDVLKAGYAEELHRRMFQRVWRWAGSYRRTEKNIGVAPHDIAPALKNLLDDTRQQVVSQAIDPRKIAARFHHRLTKIHAFPNGNGRHARLMADLLLVRLTGNAFTWGQSRPMDPGDLRRRYIQALHAADARDYEPLFEYLDVK